MVWTESNERGGANVLSLPKWTLFIRIFQLVLAFILLVLTAYSASKLGSGAAGFGLTWFTFILTVLYFVYLGVSLSAAPSAYHPLAHLPFEILVNIFWLCSWAVLASEASSIGSLQHYYGGYLDLLPSSYRSALNCVKAAAALGAILWVLFCITLAFLVIAFLEHTRNSATTADVAAASGVGAGAEAKATELHNYNNGVGGAGAPPPGGVPVDPATGYPPAQYQQQQPYGVDPNAQAAYPPQQQAAYVDPSQQQPVYAEQQQQPPVQPVQQYPEQQYQEQPVTGTVPHQQHPTA
ncbi:hypothetical protein SBRCBS47491_001182 [Sporothrix bragantina]|uniref:MARVEL domain-containing protein n=1 Tax=Sporothrix bragantina TaxID=671064 RepID=A0ABP0AWH3_9PEZI